MTVRHRHDWWTGGTTTLWCCRECGQWKIQGKGSTYVRRSEAEKALVRLKERSK